MPWSLLVFEAMICTTNMLSQYTSTCLWQQDFPHIAAASTMGSIYLFAMPFDNHSVSHFAWIHRPLPPQNAPQPQAPEASVCYIAAGAWLWWSASIILCRFHASRKLSHQARSDINSPFSFTWWLRSLTEWATSNILRRNVLPGFTIFAACANLPIRLSRSRLVQACLDFHCPTRLFSSINLPGEVWVPSSLCRSISQGKSRFLWGLPLF